MQSLTAIKFILAIIVISEPINSDSIYKRSRFLLLHKNTTELRFHQNWNQPNAKLANRIDKKSVVLHGDIQWYGRGPDGGERALRFET